MPQKLFHEPLLHFLVLGALLFGLYQWLGGPAASAAVGDIVVTEGRIRNLTDTFTRTWQRPPTPEELNGLVEDYIREEVLYREGVVLGLDRDDTIIRRRLRQKLEFVSEDAANAVEPTSVELAEFLAKNADAYRIESRLTFTQVFLDPSRRGDKLEVDAASLLDALRTRGDSLDPATLGDSRMLDPRYESATEDDIARLFGPEFELALRGQPVGKWVGPLKSGYGAHLVRIDARSPGRVATLDEVRDAVARDWSAARRQQFLDEQYHQLRNRYQVRIEGP
ncbi:MAG: peptidyl-prolyl cis-trans isomerase [Chromatiales bacterium]|nr:peptidyl-prolyl cis-trans isomerase [Chromatiales bacterium]